MDQSKDMCSYLPWIGTAVAVGYAIFVTLRSRSDQTKSGSSDSCVNKCIQKENAKVVDSLDIEDLGDKSVFCRCWISKKFPYCDGSHNKHNESCGDNVGPLIIQKKSN